MFGRKKQTAAPDPVAAAPAAVQSADANAELIAIITAAIAAFEGSATAFTNGFVVRKISRITGNSTAWSNAGLNECIDSRRF